MSARPSLSRPEHAKTVSQTEGQTALTVKQEHPSTPGKQKGQATLKRDREGSKKVTIDPARLKNLQKQKKQTRKFCALRQEREGEGERENATPPRSADLKI